jgi:hypothetical protein
MSQWPQLIVLALMLTGLGRDWANHGKAEVKTENGWTTLIVVSLLIGLLYAGGFWDGLLK